MNYENKYKDAIEWLRTLVNSAKEKGHIIVRTEDIEDTFPELADSEDDRIKRALIALLYFALEDGSAVAPGHNVTKEEALAWLEKQETSYTKKDVDDAYLKGVNDAKNEIEKQYEANYQIRKDIATFIFNYRGDIKDRAKWMDYLGIKVYVFEREDEKSQGKSALEAIREEKADNTNKVVSRFKKGDLVTNGYYRCKIESVDDTTYYCDFTNIDIKDQDKWMLVEQKADCSEEDERIRKHLISLVKNWDKDGIVSKYTSDSKEIKQILAWLEKQGEQKSVDKVEPKFKVGDWVVYDHRTYQVVELPKEGYINLGLRRNEKIEFAPSTYCRFWTIEDAKDGDVLVNGSNIFIFHFIYDTRVMGYCHINTDDGRFYNDLGRNECLFLIDGVVMPATKEQCDTLFTKMREAGYEWDANKKELKKIITEQKFKVGDWIVFNDHHESVYQIEKIENFQYTLRHISGGSMPLSFSHEDMIRLWTIEDAKPGDVLNANDAPFIYKKHDENYVYFYCGINLADEFVKADNIDTWNSNSKVYPATKEQRDILFARMKEAGYWWVAENKEPKKIEKRR